MELTSERIAELLEPFLAPAELSHDQMRSIETYLDLLLKWNSKINLTAIRDPGEIIIRHFGESLFAARELFPKLTPGSVIDVGSGAGYPGIPTIIWNSVAKLNLIESSQKKSVFLREVVRALDLKNVSIMTGRAEGIDLKATIVMVRAVEHFERILRTASGFLEPKG